MSHLSARHRLGRFTALGCVIAVISTTARADNPAATINVNVNANRHSIALTRAADPVTWLGVSVRNITGEGEMSAFGLPGVTGVLVLEVPAESPLARAGLRKNDVILSVNGARTADTAELLKQAPALPASDSLQLGVSRDQKEMVVELVR